MLSIKKPVYEAKYIREIERKSPDMAKYNKREKQFYHNCYWAIKREFERMYAILDREEYASASYQTILLLLEKREAVLKNSTKNLYKEIYMPNKVVTGHEASMYLKSFFFIPEDVRKEIMNIAFEDAKSGKRFRR